jgi:hypothetical protein
MPKCSLRPGRMAWCRSSPAARATAPRGQGRDDLVWELADAVPRGSSPCGGGLPLPTTERGSSLAQLGMGGSSAAKVDSSTTIFYINISIDDIGAETHH